MESRFWTEAVSIFRMAVKSVQPETLVQRTVQLKSSHLQIQHKKISVANNVYVVGFGKAVLGMALAVEHILGDHLVSGVISVPHGISKQATFCGLDNMKGSKIRILEGAVNNMPDESSLSAASEIARVASSCTKADLLLVLISGGGSALLPSPLPGISLEDKLSTIKQLSGRGATIEELNTVRKCLSTLKGGGLAQLAWPAQVISLILSDIIGNPLSLIASGPTVENEDDPTLPVKILEKYNLLTTVPHSIVSSLKITDKTLPSRGFNHVTNVLLGSNRDAINAALKHAEELGYVTLELTSELQGNARHIGKLLAKMAYNIIQNDNTGIENVTAELNFSKAVCEGILQSRLHAYSENKPLCLVCAGETVVEVTGNGLGGRNQELALSASLQLSKYDMKATVVILSAGTDGIDGPTTAAGAIGTDKVIEIANKVKLKPTEFLENNDSFNFYKTVDNGKWHVITGHTGTNVMDIILTLIDLGCHKNL